MLHSWLPRFVGLFTIIPSCMPEKFPKTDDDHGQVVFLLLATVVGAEEYATTRQKQRVMCDVVFINGVKSRRCSAYSRVTNDTRRNVVVFWVLYC